MSSQELGPAVIAFFHDLFTVMWVGGMITLGVAVLPSARKVFGAGPQVQRLMSAVQTRLRWFVYVSIAGLVLTGILLSKRSADFQGFFSWGDTYSITLSLKHVVVIVMIAVALVRSLALTRATLAGQTPGPGPHVGAGGADAAAVAGVVAADAAAAERTSAAQQRLPRGARLSMALLYANIVFGVVVLFLSALTAA